MVLIVAPYLSASGALLGVVDVGEYASWWKCIPLILIALIWMRLLTWADKDADEALLPRATLNMSFMGGLVLALALFFCLPYMLGLVAIVLIFFAEIGTYLFMRNKKVGLADLGVSFKDWLQSFRGKPKAVAAPVGDVPLIGKDGGFVAGPDAEDPRRQGYDAVQTLLSEPMKRGAESIALVRADENSIVRYMVDGMPYDGPVMSKADTAAAVTFLKEIAGMDPNEKRKPQKGKVRTLGAAKSKRELQIFTRGSTAGESVAIEVDTKNRHNRTLDEMGLSDSQTKMVNEQILVPAGIILLATPKREGLTSLMYAMARKHDAFLSQIFMIERGGEVEVEGVRQQDMPVDATPDKEFEVVDGVLRREPDVVLIDRIENPKSAADMVKAAGDGKRVYICVNAGNTFDALTAWRKIVGNDSLAMKNLNLVIAGRLIRKLCNACKAEYSPDPETLRRLNMSPDKVGTLFQARSKPQKDASGVDVICTFCNGLNFKGRTGVYETFIIDDEVRQTVEAGGSVNQLKMLFKKQKQKSLQEQAVAKAVAGDTSLYEVGRMVKNVPAEAAKPAAPAPASAKPSSRPQKKIEK